MSHRKVSEAEQPLSSCCSLSQRYHNISSWNITIHAHYWPRLWVFIYEDRVKQCHVEQTLLAYTLTVQNLTQRENTDIIDCRGHRGRKLAPEGTLCQVRTKFIIPHLLLTNLMVMEISSLNWVDILLFHVSKISLPHFHWSFYSLAKGSLFKIVNKITSFLNNRALSTETYLIRLMIQILELWDNMRFVENKHWELIPTYW